MWTNMMGKLNRLIAYGHLPNKCPLMDMFLTLFQPSIKFCGFKTLTYRCFLTLFQPNMWIISPKPHAILATIKYVDIKLKKLCIISK